MPGPNSWSGHVRDVCWPSLAGDFAGIANRRRAVALGDHHDPVVLAVEGVVNRDGCVRLDVELLGAFAEQHEHGVTQVLRAAHEHDVASLVQGVRHLNAVHAHGRGDVGILDAHPAVGNDDVESCTHLVLLAEKYHAIECMCSGQTRCGG